MIPLRPFTRGSNNKQRLIAVVHLGCQSVSGGWRKHRGAPSRHVDRRGAKERPETCAQRTCPTTELRRTG
ncbi:hypothetical protein PBY51_000112 [Eleginops maclovinus]|uniref:Uncharacterized protein n=1 Tax=Eleginops maclovinus TaxID=56733 RepID=A0AAN8ANU7_ELEMC|nr:hypothetical protein PBY51_000112 [Eleginops maclovinus]